MIDLEPIPQQIQRRLFEKKRVLSRDKNNTPNTSKSKDIQYGLTHAKMATRSTFLRMTSGQLNPVILMGGKLKDDGSIPGGYDDIYGSRTYKTGGKKGEAIELFDLDETVYDYSNSVPDKIDKFSDRDLYTLEQGYRINEKIMEGNLIFS